MKGLFRDIRFAARGLIAQPGFTITAIVTLALAVGVNAVMLDVLDRLLVRDPPGVRDPGQVSRIYFGSGQGSVFPRTNFANFADVKNDLSGYLDAIATYKLDKLSLGRGRTARQVTVTSCSREYFDVLGLVPSLGVLPGRGANVPDEGAVISHALWQQHFGGAPDVLGRALRLGTQAFTIVGVAPKEFAGVDTEATDIWLPLEMRGSVMFGPDWRSSRGYISLDIIARFKPSASRQAFDRAASEIYRLRNEKRSIGRNARVVAGDLLLARAPTGDREVNVAVWIAAVSGLVLLIGCGNVAALVLVRGIARSRELAVKAAVGATRARLAREILIEAVVLGAASSALAMVLVAWGDAALPQLFTPGLWTVGTFDSRLASLTAAVSAIAAILLGALPALQLSSARNLAPGHKLQAHRGHSRTLDALLVFQLALTLPLLTGAGLFTASFENARRQNTGLDLDRIVVVTTNLAEFGEPSRNHPAHRELATRLAELPQVEASALVGSIPLVSGLAFWLEMDDVEFAAGILPYANTVDPSYFKVMGIPMVRGRSLVESDNHPGARRVAVVNEAMARAVEKRGSILGRCLYLQGREKGCTEIVGVSRDAWQFAGGKAEPAFVVAIEPFRELASERAVLVRTKDDPKQVIDLLRREARASGPGLPYVDVWPLGDVFESMLRPWKLGTWMFAGFGVLALTISSVGLAGTIAYSVQRRRRELGIRKALGAQDSDLLAAVLRRTAAVVLVSVIAGLAGASASAASLKALLFGIEPTEWRVYAIAAALMAGVAVVAAWVPARRAAAIDPSELLRSE